jgi:cytochrome c peroxidase
MITRHWFGVLLLGGSLVSAGFLGCAPATPPAPPKPPVVTPPAKTEPAKEMPADPVKPEPVKTEPAKPEPKESTKADPPKTEPAKEPASPVVVAKVEKAEPPKSKKVLLGSPELTAGIPGSGPLTIEQIKVWLDDPKNHETLDIELPLGLSAGIGQMKGLKENPLTRAKIELGRQLYFDGRLSKDGKISCASCHSPDEGFAAHSQFGVGIEGLTGGRNSPVAYNRILSDKQFWDGRAGSLEEQALGPIQNPIEMGHTHEACMEGLTKVEGYKVQLEKIYGSATIENVGKAIASFERAMVSAPTPFDYYEQWKPYSKLDEDDIKDLKDDEKQYAAYEKAKAAYEGNKISDSARRGRDLFFSEKANCTACHVGPNLADELYHNLGVGMAAEKPDLGRFEISKDEKDTGAFKTPTIRNVEYSAPYMHDGSQKTLEEVVEWYAKGGHPNPHLDPKVKKLELSAEDKQDLVAFMKACSSPFPKVERKRLPE